MGPIAGQISANDDFELTAPVESATENTQAELLDHAFDTAFHMSGVQAYLEYYQIA